MLTSCSHLASRIDSGGLDNQFATLYGCFDVDMQKRRYIRLLNLLGEDKPGAEAMFVNAPGRTELGGNHTDHNHGCVLAAAVDLDCVAVVTPVEAQNVTLRSEDYVDPIHVDLNNLEPHLEEHGRPEALVRGMAAGFYERTGVRRGFSGSVNATCLPGTGLSSSAAFSVMVGAAFNFLFFNNRLTAEDLAIMAREAENRFFGKPCGLMDQMASAVGQTIYIDFEIPEKPVVERIKHTLEETEYRLVLIDTGGSHVGLTAEYAAIPEEMCAAARVLGKDFGRGITLDEFLQSIGEIRQQAGDRAALRLLHFIEENDRAAAMADYLKKRKSSEYLQCVAESGKSSCNLLQNCATNTSSRQQGILMALAVSRLLCPQAVCRVHGGGFAGTVQAYVPVDDYKHFSTLMEEIFGLGSVIPIQIGRPGVCGLNGGGLILPQKADTEL